MRLGVLIVAMALLPGASAAQEMWERYLYSDMEFAADFPTPPTITEDVYTASLKEEAPKSQAPARVYTASLPTAIYRVTVAAFSDRIQNGANLLGEAVDYLHYTQKLRADVSARIGSGAAAVFGRHVTYDRSDGARVTTGYFFMKGRLYIIEAIILPSSSDIATPDAARFQQSLELSPRR